jgi:hypothetical protein
MATLADHLLNDEARPRLVDDCCRLIDEEVGKKKGVTGFAIKGAYKTVKAIKRGFIPGVVGALLDEWVAKLEPYYAEHAAAGAGAPFSSYVNGRKDAVAESLLEVTDARAQTTTHKTAAKMYGKLRPGAKVNVIEALPGLGRVVDGYLTA